MAFSRVAKWQGTECVVRAPLFVVSLPPVEDTQDAAQTRYRVYSVGDDLPIVRAGSALCKTPCAGASLRRPCSVVLGGDGGSVALGSAARARPDRARWFSVAKGGLLRS